MTRPVRDSDTVVAVTADPDAGEDVSSDEPSGDVMPEAARRGGMSARRLVASAIAVPVVLLAAFVGGRALRDDGGAGLRIGDAPAAERFDWEYVIPEGTAARLSAGERIEIVPAELVVRVGDTIRIVNNDTVNHIVGVFFIGAGETMTQQFQSAGELEGECSVHPSGAFTLRVEAA